MYNTNNNNIVLLRTARTVGDANKRSLGLAVCRLQNDTHQTATCYKRNNILNMLLEKKKNVSFSCII